MATSKPSLISSRPPLPLTDIASQVWAESTREPVPLSKIPTHTHESGVAVTIFARQKERWPDVTLTPASKLVSRVFEKYDDRTGEYRLATLAETLPYLLDSLPPWLARYRLSCMPGNEADVMYVMETGLARSHCIESSSFPFSAQARCQFRQLPQSAHYRPVPPAHRQRHDSRVPFGSDISEGAGYVKYSLNAFPVC